MKKVKNNRKRKINFPTEIILNYLKETSKNLLDLSVAIIFDPDKLIKDAGFYVKYPSFSSSINRWINSLETNSSFKFKENKIYLTKKGRIKIIKSIIKEKYDNFEWDGKWRAVTFDVPETNRRERRFLRNELKTIKLKELQKSLWVCPYNIEKELFALLKLWKTDFKGDIRFLKIDKIAEDKDLIQSFNL
ncbi:MAG: phenylacetic acid degradation operon negative regulatory protein [Parcubacteria group bacterium Licking1014_1]|nr:MAG: phenylacetic acid degradation operon negative regulatory protein [Parcubacteria group bacterium Licking1014_1]